MCKLTLKTKNLDSVACMALRVTFGARNKKRVCHLRLVLDWTCSAFVEHI